MTQPSPPSAAPAEYPAPADHYGQIESGAAAIAALVAGGDLGLPIPTCPEWTLRELAIHVGRAHRWAAQIAATRSPKYLEFGSVPDGRFPGDAAAQAGWLTAGARRAVAAIGEAGQDQVWTFGTVGPASFYGRRMGHETMVHAADAQLAAGQRSDLPAALAADAIDEWLTVLMPLVVGPPDPREQALPPGAALHVQPAGAGGWVVRREPAGVTVTRTAGPAAAGPGGADVVLAGPAAALLLVLMGRVPARDPAVTVSGDRALLDRWLGAAQF
jgi:uncharacterized protein (TIGR03083 family)